MNTNRLLYILITMPIVLFTACAYDEDFENTTENCDLMEIADRYYYKCDSLDVVNLPEGVRSIGDLAFFGSSITSLGIPSEVSYIGSNAFNFCTNLTSIRIDVRNMVFDSRNDCNAIIRTEDDLLVYGCSETVIPSSVKAIDDYAFCGCSGLGDLFLADQIEEMGDGAFSECSGLTSVTLPERLQKVSTLAFAECPDLVEVTIPQSVTSIGDGAFLHCYKLSKVRVMATIPPSCGYIAFFNIDATLYVPQGLRGVYASARGWSDFKTIIEE